MLEKRYAQEAGWKGQPVKQLLQTTGGEVQEWNTKFYWIPLVDRLGKVHRIMAYEMDTIAAPLEAVDVQAAKQILPAVDLEAVKRPEGRINLLIGIHEASIFPFVANRKKNIDGNLKLLTSIFGSGWLPSF